MRRMTATDPLATADLQERAHRHLLMHFTRNGAFGPGASRCWCWSAARAYVFDTEGKRYFDGLSSLFCAQIGYSFGEEMAAVASAQLTTLAFNTNWATAHPAGDRPRGGDRGARARRPQPRLLHQRRLGVGRGRLEDRPPVTTSPTASRSARRRSRARSPTTASRSARSLHRRAPDEGAVRRRADPGRAGLRTRTASARPDGRGRRRPTQRLLAELEAAIVEAGPETVAMIIAEPVQNAGGCLVPPEGYWPACESSPTSTGSRWWPTRSSRASGASASGSPPPRYGDARRRSRAPRASPPPTRRWAP